MTGSGGMTVPMAGTASPPSTSPAPSGMAALLTGAPVPRPSALRTIAAMMARG
ncbi:MAG: hypothetical protein ACHP9Z_17195 [Streptosporangiales bacterium]